MTKLGGTACEGPVGDMNTSGEAIELELVDGYLEMEPVLQAELSGSLNYATWQNSIPLIRSLAVRNDSGEAWNDLELLLITEPSFAPPKRWVIDRINPGDCVTLPDYDLDLDSSYLNGLNEAERAQVHLNFAENDPR